VQACNLPPVEILAIHARVPEAAVPGTWRELAAELQDHLRRCRDHSSQPVGAIFPDPFHDERAVNMTVYVPCPAGVGGKGRIVREHLPGGPCATIRHLGPYTLLHHSYEYLAAWMQRHGHETAGAPREVYLVGPAEASDPRNYETNVIWPIREAALPA
jgi:effector-binding domain-containing protein